MKICESSLATSSYRVKINLGGCLVLRNSEISLLILTLYAVLQPWRYGGQCDVYVISNLLQPHCVTIYNFGKYLHYPNCSLLSIFIRPLVKVCINVSNAFHWTNNISRKTINSNLLHFDKSMLSCKELFWKLLSENVSAWGNKELVLTWLQTFKIPITVSPKYYINTFGWDCSISQSGR